MNQRMKQGLAVTLTCLILLAAFPVFGPGARASSYMSDKTEIPVDLEVSGAEALCQTEDGYVWIAQYSGLTRYDSKEFETYKSFEYEGRKYSVINVRALASEGNTLYIGTSEHIYVYRDNHFEPLLMDPGVVTGIYLDKEKDLLYISTQNNGAIILDINKGTTTPVPGSEGIYVRDIALDLERDNFYYQTASGVYDKNGDEVFQNTRLLEIYAYGTTLFMAEDSGIIHRYDLKNGVMLDAFTIPDQVNRMLYSEEDRLLFVACEKDGIYCVDFSTGAPTVSLAGDLSSKSQLVDLMIDYEGNLWVASHYIGSSGVSIITRNALSEMLYDDPVWQSLNAPPAFDRNVYAVEKYGDILYIVAAARIYRYDLTQNLVLPDNAIMQSIDAYAEAKTQEGRAQGDGNFEFTYSPKDVELFRNKIYFAVSGIGLVEYDPASEAVVIYDQNYIADHHGKLVGDPVLETTNTPRCLRSFDDYLAIGYTRGLMRFDGTEFSVMYLGTNVLYINKTKDGQLLYDRTQGLFVVDDDFSSVEEIPTEKGVTGNRLKFLVDGDLIYYTLNSRLFRLDTSAGDGVSEEITIPYIKGSIVELAKIRFGDKDGEPEYKYVIGSQSQLYITDSLDGDRLTDYEIYDSTNGLNPIIANTSGYYDEAEQKYYLQSTNGVFVYDFNKTRDIPSPVKIVISSVDLDGARSYGDNITIAKDVYRVAFNLSILGFRPNNGFTIYYKLDGIDDDYTVVTDDNRSASYTNLAGGSYDFYIYVTDEYGQSSNVIRIHLEKEKKVVEQWWFWAILAVVAAGVVFFIAALFVRIKTRQSLKRQLEYKNITVESIQAIARTIDAKDEYTNGHSIRVGAYSKKIAENLGMSSDEVDNIYYIALLHDIGKIAIPDNILNKPGRLNDDEFAVMKSHTSRGAAILKGISTIPQIIEGAKSHHEKYDGSGYPEGLKGEDIPFVARIICCADCFDAMASKRVYKEPYSLDVIIKEFERCAGTQFDPKISKVVVDMIATGKLKPYSAENTYLGSDGKTHRIKKNDNPQNA
ncbi:MAG: HD domain-containing protein [Clostridia bacterium]|nr:HD domain-containing protein [Clostridia bacterium]